MPKKDSSHEIIKQAIQKDGWEVTDDPYVISYGERFLFVDLGADRKDSTNYMNSQFIGAHRNGKRIAVEIKTFRSKSIIYDLEQAIGQYVLYSLLLNKVDPERKMYLAVTDIIYEEIFNEPIGELVISDLPLSLIVVDQGKKEVKKWITPNYTEK